MQMLLVTFKLKLQKVLCAALVSLVGTVFFLLHAILNTLLQGIDFGWQDLGMSRKFLGRQSVSLPRMELVPLNLFSKAVHITMNVEIL